MSVLRIHRWPDAHLSERCEPVGDMDVSGLVNDLFETMYEAAGRGLAAPQVGAMQRVFVMDCGWKDGEKTPVVCIDPEILWSSPELARGDEGCLSIPGILAAVTRPESIRLRYRDATDTVQEETLSGAEATCAQHEFDHLNGIVTLDRLSAAERQSAEESYRFQ